MNITLIIILLAVFGLISLILFFTLRSGTTPKTTESLYSDGLQLLLDGDLTAAADKLKAVVRKDTNHVDAYIKLGDIFRENAQYTQALKVHQSLTVRRNLFPGQRIDIYLSLVRDYEALGEYEKALQTAEKILETDKKNIKGLNAELRIYQAMDHWDAAVETLKTIQKLTNAENQALVALYRVQEGLILEEKGEAREGRIRYRKALKIDPRCCAALYYLGNSYDREERVEEAVENWEKFGEICPELLYLVSEKIEQHMFELGNFGEIERYYRRLLESNPANIEAAAGIASFYDKKGQTDNAILAIENAMGENPDSVRARLLLSKLYNKKKAHDKLEEQLDAILSDISQQQTFRCEECGATFPEIRWLCPECYHRHLPK